MYETTIKGFKIRLTNSLREGLLKEWNPDRVTIEGSWYTLPKKESCTLCEYDNSHVGGRPCRRCPIGKLGCYGLFEYLLGKKAHFRLDPNITIFYHTLKTSRRYVQKIKDTILAMKRCPDPVV